MEQFNNLPLFRKILLFSFFISLILVVSTAGISLIIQTKQMEQQLRFRIIELSSVWGTTIDVEDIKKVSMNKEHSNPSFHKLKQSLTLLSEKAPYTNGSIIAPEISKEDEVFILVSSDNQKELGIESFSTFQTENTFLKGFNEAIFKQSVTSSSIYRGKSGLWIAAFVPIMDQEGKIAGILSLNIDAKIIEKYQNEITLYLIGIFLIIIIFVYFILRRGLEKVLNPVNEIISGFNEVSNGNFSVRLKSSDQNELGILVERFNNMTDKLSVLFERLSATSEEFGTGNGKVAPIHRFEDAIGEMEQILQKSKVQRELQRAEKMNAIGQLAASVAHEIRNPMTVVKGFLQIFLAKEQMSDEERMYIRLMIEEMNRAETIINDYLSLAKPDIEHLEMVDASELASKVMDLMNSYAMMSKNIKLETVLHKGVHIKCNPSELKQVLINIVKNGIEAMRDGGNLSIYIYKEKGYGVIEIGDTGIGMSDVELERLGTAFYSLKEKGTGMGMMVCYQIIERMKGKIEVKSQAGRGTTFKIYVPLAEI